MSRWKQAFSALALIACCTVNVTADTTAETLANVRKQRDLNAVQIVYRKFVPHVDKQGNRLTKYDPGRSFFPIGIWAPNHGEVYNQMYDWNAIRDAGFNTVWIWPANPPEKSLELAREFSLQAIVGWDLTEEQLKAVNDHPNLLANLFGDEPIGKLGSIDMDKEFKRYTDYIAMAKKVAPNVKVFINDAPWFTEPATEWWMKWNTTASIICNDNYPLMMFTESPRTIGADPRGIPQTVSLEVAANHAEKPVWLIVGAFEEPRPNSPFPFRFGTPAQLRAQAYAAVIHGATGIHWFAMDSYITRQSMVIGMHPDPKPTVSPDPAAMLNAGRQTPATPIQLVQSRAAWETAKTVNHELQELAPAIFSPTVMQDDFDYKVEVVGEAVSPTPIRCLLKRDPAGQLVLITVNLDDAALDVTYRFPKAVTGVVEHFSNQPALPLAEDRTSLSVRYEPFVVKVLEIQE